MSRHGVEPKPAWRSLPEPVRAGVARALGAPVRRAERVYGGYSPAPTFRLLLGDGRRAFVKGTGPRDNPFAIAALEREVRYYRELEPVIGDWSPRCYGSLEQDGWRILLLEDLGPASVPPWTDAAARAVLRGFAGFHRSTLGRQISGRAPPASDYLSPFAGTWQELLVGGKLEPLAGIAVGAEQPARTWLERHVQALAAVSLRLGEAPPPYALLHGDLRSDNLRLTRGTLRMFDWPHLGIGPPEFDAVGTVQSITVEGGPPPERLMTWYAAELPPRPEVLDAAVAATAGFFAALCWQPDIPGLPRLRPFQRAQFRVCLAWAARRLSLPDPAWLEQVTG